MKVVVIGGTGRVGSALVAKIRTLGHEAVAASPKTGVDALTGEGLVEALAGTAVVVDVSNAPSFADADVLAFFTASTGNLLAESARAGVRHYVALSVVGTDRVPDSGYLRAKAAQEALIRASPVPYTIVRATQFFEFVDVIAAAATDGQFVRVPPVRFRPIAADDVAEAISHVAVGAAGNTVVEIAGPDEFRFDELVRDALRARGDVREVVTDADARYFGAALAERSLVPLSTFVSGATSWRTWLDSAPAPVSKG
jgi:uncharacterized protein YbjT (DUF2867 family)